MKLCIVTPHQTTLTETFIRAHLERLPHDVTHIHGYYLDYRYNDVPLRERHDALYGRTGGRLLNLLPRYAEFRLRQRLFKKDSDEQVVRQFLSDEQIDVVLAEYGMMGAFMKPICQSLDIPLVVHFHGADATQHKYIDELGDQYREMFQYAHCGIAVSERMRRDLIGLGCAPDRARVCTYGPNPDFYEVQPDYESNTLVAVGRLTAKKAPHLLILAMQRVIAEAPQLRLNIVGDGELMGVCCDLIASLGLGEQITLSGAGSVRDVCAAMQESFLFVQHSVEAADGDCEGTPLAVLESGAAGLPVVATEHAGIPDVVVPESTGLLVPERDIQKMAECILRLHRDRRLAKQMGGAAREHIKTNFSIEKHLDAVNEVLMSAVAAKVSL